MPSMVHAEIHNENAQNIKNTFYLNLLKDIHTCDAYFLGNYAKNYEYELAQYFGSLYAINTDSKIKSMVNVLKGHGIGRDDEVICTSYSMSQTVSALIQEKIVPVFADLNAMQYSMSFEHTQKLISSKTKAIILSYPYGIPNQVHLFKDLAEKNNILLIEDIQSTLGSSWRDQLLGTFGDVAFFNHHPKNQLFPSQAGLCITDKTHIAKMVRPNVQEPYSVLHELSEFFGAVGLFEMKNFQETQEANNQIYQIYRNYLSNLNHISVYQDRNQSFAIKSSLPIRVHAEERDYFFNAVNKVCSFSHLGYDAAHNNALINVMLRPPHLPNTETLIQETFVIDISKHRNMLEHVAIAEKIQKTFEGHRLSA